MLKQSLLSVVGPSHMRAPVDGCGLEQVLVLILLPEPHLAEQAEKADQLLQPPLTEHGSLLHCL